jgi:hypothetical protein
MYALFSRVPQEPRHYMGRIYVDTTSTKESRYDMIVGRDLMYSIGLDLRFSDSTMVWDNTTVPMRSTKWLEANNL